MTEAEWLASANPDPMCRYLEKTHPAQRKPRLLAVAWCRRFPDRRPDSWLSGVLSVVESFADGLVGRDDLRTAERTAAEVASSLDVPTLTPDVFHRTAYAVEEAAYDDPGAPYTFRLTDVTRRLAQAAGYAAAPLPWAGVEQDRLAAFKEAEAIERRALAELVREIFGNPFRPVALDPAWRTDTAESLARGMYESRDFSPMPILADALQDAGCDNDAVLSHCRDASATHVRGCWVVDLVLRRE